MANHSETIWHRFLDIVDPTHGGVPVQDNGRRTARHLEHIEHGLHLLHAKLDRIHADNVRIIGRIEDMDAHVKALADAVNSTVTTINTSTANIAEAIAAIQAGLTAEDRDAIDAAVASLSGANSALAAANASLSQANHPVASASGGQATPAVPPAPAAGEASGADTAGQESSKQ